MRAMRSAVTTILIVMMSASAHAACNVANPPAFSQKPSLGTMTSDQAKIEGGCVDGTPIGANRPSTGNFTNLSINGSPVIPLSSVPDCPDTGGQHLNFSGGVFTCGTSGGSGSGSELIADAGGNLLTDNGGNLITP